MKFYNIGPRSQGYALLGFAEMNLIGMPSRVCQNRKIASYMLQTMIHFTKTSFCFLLHEGRE